MMESFLCPYLRSEIYFPEERQRHVAERHPELWGEYRHLIAETLAMPDQVRSSHRDEDARLFSKWYDKVRNGKHVVVVVMAERGTRRRWVATAYLARRLSGGDVEWKKN